jgi:HD-like signal output (HDOD) protein
MVKVRRQAAGDSKVSIAECVSAIDAIDMLPEVAMRVIRMTEDPSSTAARLNDIVLHDPALSSRILKVVNSPFYGLPGHVTSVERAIVLLGMTAVRNIAVAASMGRLFRNVRLCDGLTTRDLWRHCILVAVAAAELAKCLKQSTVDEAFFSGMIHDIGLLAIVQTTPDKAREAFKRASTLDVDLCTIEQDLLGFDHQQLGAALAEHWRFPRNCQLAASHHHRPAELAEDVRGGVMLIYVADTLCARAGSGFTLSASRQKIEEDDLACCNLSGRIVRQLAANFPKLAESAGAFL